MNIFEVLFQTSYRSLFLLHSCFLISPWNFPVSKYWIKHPPLANMKYFVSAKTSHEIVRKSWKETRNKETIWSGKDKGSVSVALICCGWERVSLSRYRCGSVDFTARWNPEGVGASCCCSFEGATRKMGNDRRRLARWEMKSGATRDSAMRVGGAEKARLIPWPGWSRGCGSAFWSVNHVMVCRSECEKQSRLRGFSERPWAGFILGPVGKWLHSRPYR